MKQISYGILGCGSIAAQFASDLRHSPHSRLQAVASRSAEKAKSFARKHSADKYYGDYQSLLNDPQVDAVYIATIHPHHYQLSKQALQAGKAVLCEKPLTMNAQESLELAELSRSSNLFYAEAFWTAYFPAVKMLRTLVEEKTLGRLLHIEASFCANLGGNGGGSAEADTPGDRWRDPELGGGALLDIGIYPLAFSMMMFNASPSAMKSLVEMGPQGVDEEELIILGFEGGGNASLRASFRYNHPHVARLIFEKGGVYVPDFFHPADLILYCNPEVDRSLLPEGDYEELEAEDDSPSPGRQYFFPFEGRGYQYEAEAVSLDLLEGRKESSIYATDRSIAVLRAMDALRKEWNLRYEGEKDG